MNELNERTKRIAARQNSLERNNIELQEVCHNYWQSGRNISVLRSNARMKVTQRMVYDYFKVELCSIGVKSYAAFKKLLVLRQKRISRLNSARK